VFFKDSALKKQSRRLVLLLLILTVSPSEAAFSCKNILGSVQYFFLKAGRDPLEQAFLEMNRIKEYPVNRGRLLFKNLESADIDQAENLLGASKSSFFGQMSSEREMVFSSIVFNIINIARNPFVHLSKKSKVASNELAFYSIKDQALVGFLGADFDFIRKRIYISYVVDEFYRGQGYATEALSSFMNEIQENIKGRVIFMGTVYKTNGASIRVLEKTGFEFLGDDGQSADIYLYRKLLSLY
jgi:RimJ/RimL family protein N-acetyltransferase